MNYNRRSQLMMNRNAYMQTKRVYFSVVVRYSIL